VAQWLTHYVAGKEIHVAGYRQVHDYITSYSLAVMLILSTGAALYCSITFQHRIYKQLLAICILWTNLYETNQYEWINSNKYSKTNTHH